ncbi:hypothetical protein JAAARDRAFT_430563 [Jaapia argillacea MUCL 33604]|uniref:Uncharacterized protein n=1 Tax=Jaapia argillacea MUCL 33604 TaxID=933084 RepID=A0A067PTG8_9AGAM|nr:hypothetical protein JAAARDRAFT_430563 [Jaapia argillacea MUCL 33604]
MRRPHGGFDDYHGRDPSDSEFNHHDHHDHDPEFIFINSQVYQLRRVETSSTISDLPGPGRTLGNAISQLGRILERRLTLWAERLGHGPNAAALRILRILEDLECCPCLKPERRSAFVGPSPTGKTLQFETILVTLFRTIFQKSPSHSPFSFDDKSGSWKCANCGNTRKMERLWSDRKRKALLNECQRLVSMISRGNLSTQALATSYIAALAPSHPFFQSSFILTGTIEALENVLSTNIAYNRETKVLSAAKLMGQQGKILEMNSPHLAYSPACLPVRILGFWDISWYDRSTPSHDPKAKVMSAWDGVVENNRNVIQLLHDPQTRALAATTLARLYTPLSHQHIPVVLTNALFAEKTFRDPANIQYLWYELSRAKDFLDQLALLHLLEILCGLLESPMGLMNQVSIEWKWRAFFEPALRLCTAMPSFSSPFLDRLFRHLLDVMEMTPYKISYIFPCVFNVSPSSHPIRELDLDQTQPPASGQPTSATFSLASRSIQTLLNPFFHYRIQLSLNSNYIQSHSLRKDVGGDTSSFGVKKALVRSVADALAHQILSLFDHGHCTAGQVVQVCEDLRIWNSESGSLSACLPVVTLPYTQRLSMGPSHIYYTASFVVRV